MSARLIKQGRGRPISGSEAKTRHRKFNIEPSLDDELKFTCRILGIPVAEGIRQAIIRFIRDVQKNYR